MEIEEVETLDFDMDDKSPKDEIEMLDFEIDRKISDEIDEMLDFMDTPKVKEDNNNEIEQLESLLETSKNDKTDVEIDASLEKLDDYEPSLKDFNIKNALTRKIVKKSMLYIIIAMLIGFEFFITKSGDALNNLVVYASDNQPIKIVQNEKYGYIDYFGDKIVNPKYTYGEDFLKGYAIVKNTSNLPLIIDKGGKEVVKTGDYFTIYRAKTDIIVSKVTKKGLKFGILDANLKKKTDFEYDSITYKDGVYTFVKDNTVGLINESGKEVYSYKLTNKEDKTIDVVPCPVTNIDYQRYGVVTINSSSFIVNLNDGTNVYSPTLDQIVPVQNNVFYKLSQDKIKTFIYVENNKVLVESESYNSLSIDSIETGVLKAINTNYNYEFISTKTLEQLSKGLTNEDTYYGDGVFVYNAHNYKRNKDALVFVKNGEAYKTLDKTYSIYKPFKNGVATVKFEDETYGYINEDAELITDKRFISVTDFDEYGEAIAQTNDGYGVINKNGKTIIEFENEEIKMASNEVKTSSISNSTNVFYAVKKSGKFNLYNSKGKKVNKERYTDVILDEHYPIIKVATDIKDSIIIAENFKEISLTTFNAKYEAYENYIIIKNEYYNYKGKLIYVDNSKESLGE